MPHMDGIEALSKIREIEKENGVGGLDGVKVIMTTAKNLSKDVFEAFKTGCESYLIKPIKKKDVVAEIEKLGLATPTT
jgi:two-component system, chemotaxis family, chemotaxis protein CheY